jgi:hypothetical protein
MYILSKAVGINQFLFWMSNQPSVRRWLMLTDQNDAFVILWASQPPVKQNWLCWVFHRWHKTGCIWESNTTSSVLLVEKPKWLVVFHWWRTQLNQQCFTGGEPNTIVVFHWWRTQQLPFTQPNITSSVTLVESPTKPVVFYWWRTQVSPNSILLVMKLLMWVT